MTTESFCFQLLTPAPDMAAVIWKRAKLKTAYAWIEKRSKGGSPKMSRSFKRTLRALAEMRRETRHTGRGSTALGRSYATLRVTGPVSPSSSAYG